jgi:hypothetical protein
MLLYPADISVQMSRWYRLVLVSHGWMEDISSARNAVSASVVSSIDTDTDLAMHAILSASRRSILWRAGHLALLRCHCRSSRESGALLPIPVSHPSQLHRKRSPTESMLQNQQLRARNSTTRDERSKSCDCWMQHMHNAWQQKKQQQQQQQQP